MFGSEHSGIDHADPSVLAGSRVILTPTAATDRVAVARVAGFWRRLGLVPLEVSPVEHDRRLARASHLPQVLSSLLMGLQDDRSIAVSGRGLTDTTRLAGSDPRLWADILLDNRDQVGRELASAGASLYRLARALQRGDRRAVTGFIEAGQSGRRRLLKLRGTT